MSVNDDFKVSTLTGLLSGGAPPKFLRQILAIYRGEDHWRASAPLPGEDAGWRDLPPIDPGCSTLVLGQREYPPLLTLLSAPPPVLFMEGDHSLLGPAVGVTGSREMTSIGRSIVPYVVESAHALGAPLVSGAAKGVDEYATRSMLAKPEGRVIAVIGGSLDTADARTSDLLGSVVSAGGVAVSEAPPGSPVLPSRLMARNRLIAILAYPLVVVEAAVPSGSLGCARMALANDTPLVVPLPRPSFRDRPTAAGLLALAGHPSAMPLPWSPRELASGPPANGVCETSVELRDAVSVFWWLRPRSERDLQRRRELLQQRRSRTV
jgi:hypothetical protein